LRGLEKVVAVVGREGRKAEHGLVHGIALLAHRELVGHHGHGCLDRRGLGALGDFRQMRYEERVLAVLLVEARSFAALVGGKKCKLINKLSRH